jgi:hypothetical protein
MLICSTKVDSLVQDLITTNELDMKHILPRAKRSFRLIKHAHETMSKTLLVIRTLKRKKRQCWWRNKGLILGF